jgi:thioredoxin-related protein
VKYLFLLAITIIHFHVAAQEIKLKELTTCESLISTKASIVLFSFKGCGNCIKMKKELFSDSNYVKLLDEKFNLFEVDILKEPYGVELKNKYKPTTYPMLIMFSNNGEIINQIGYCNKSDFELFLSVIEKPENSFFSKLSGYKKGQMSKKETARFFYQLADINLLDKEDAILFLDKLTTEDYQDPLFRKLLFDFMFLNNKPLFDITSSTFLFYKDNLDLFINDFESKELYYRLVATYSKPLEDAVISKDSTLMNYYAQELSLVADSIKNDILTYTNYVGGKTGVLYGGFHDLFMPFYYYYVEGNHNKSKLLLADFINKIENNRDLVDNYLSSLKTHFGDEEYILNSIIQMENIKKKLHE